MVARSATTDMLFLQAMFWNLRWRHFLRKNLKRLPLRMRLKTRWLSFSESYIFFQFFSVAMETLCTYATTCIFCCVFSFLILLIHWLLQRAKVTTCTPMTTELFMQWRNKKTEEKEAGLAAQRADRAKNDRMRFCLFHLLNLVIYFSINAVNSNFYVFQWSWVVSFGC